MICDSRFANCKYFFNIMKKHNGMRPQDILIILKLLSSSKVSNAWNEVNEDAGVYSLKQFILIPNNNKKIASSLQISEAEVSESLRRSEYSGLISDAKVKKVNKLLDTTQKKITNSILNRARKIANKADTGINKLTYDDFR